MKLQYLSAAAAVILAGCSTQSPVISQRGTPSGKAIDGVVYFLPKALMQVNYDPAAEGGAVLSVTPVLYGDVNASYVAQAQFSGTADDVITLGVNDRQLLNIAKADTDDRSDEIVTAIVDTLRIQPSAKARTDDESDNKKRQFLVDPYRLGSQNGVTVQPIGAQFPSGTGRKSCPENSSLCVPVMVPVKVTYQSASVLTVVPHPQEVIGINMKRKPCVKTENTMTIQNGILTQYQVKKPSELAGCASIPLKIVEAIIAAPFDAITGRTAKLTQQKAEIDAQVALLEAQKKLAEANAAAAE